MFRRSLSCQFAVDGRKHSVKYLATTTTRTHRIALNLIVDYQASSRTYTNRVGPKQSSVHLDDRFWDIANFTRAIRKYLGSGHIDVAALKSNPSEGWYLAP